ncbi:MAG: hypothetical protein KKF20_05700 [Bacteroidetes bacterium]|nr:hypothetical protein [Bacteroidota bacterium]MBU1421727.1 hypothetical protein [Bacteroidota bacterium]MBU2471883.1 hypothetical protein [Bacteroidota bacterium]MBU2636384.1 hypothetical protein [Bacteroidota bacterium]
MQNIFDNYIKSIASKFSHVETSEMGYRADFEILLKRNFYIGDNQPAQK